MARATGPIADLSYRNYDGPMFDVTNRWWVIAKMVLRQSLKKKGFWAWTLLSTMGYVFLSVVYYFMDTMQQSGGALNRAPAVLNTVVWKDHFYLAFDMAQLWIFFLSLLVGAGVVASDTRANALLVYLSKPVSKLDYLLGKWFGMFLMLVLVTGVPAIVFLGFTWLSYRQQGTWDSLLLFKALLVIALPAVLHASVMLGLSSMFTQPRLAGATYAGIYFLSTFIASIMLGMSFRNHERGIEASNDASYLSIDGLIEGLTKVILGTRGAVQFPPSRSAEAAFAVAPPSGLMVLAAYLVVCGIFIAIAWKRVRAVEVVGS